VVNEGEAEFLSGVRARGEESQEQAADALSALGPRTVIITMGSEGAFVASGILRTRVPSFPVTVVDTTAAGDTFCGALAVALGERSDLETALRFASAAAALSVTRLGAQPSIPTRAEIDEFLRARTAP
jgi:ribokinase